MHTAREVCQDDVSPSVDLQNEATGGAPLNTSAAALTAPDVQNVTDDMLYNADISKAGVKRMVK